MRGSSWLGALGHDLRAAAASRRRRSRHQVARPGPKSTVVLVHGHLGHPSDLESVARRVHGRGHRVLAPLRSHRQRLEDSVAQLGRLLQRMPGPVHLVGHSLGGVIAARALVDHPDRIASLVTIAAPLAGAPLAALRASGRGPLKDLAPGSPSLPDLRALAGMADRVLLVAAGQDPIVPRDSALPAQVPASQVVGALGHLGVMGEAAVLDAVDAHICERAGGVQPDGSPAPWGA